MGTGEPYERILGTSEFINHIVNKRLGVKLKTPKLLHCVPVEGVSRISQIKRLQKCIKNNRKELSQSDKNLSCSAEIPVAIQ